MTVQSILSTVCSPNKGIFHSQVQQFNLNFSFYTVNILDSPVLSSFRANYPKNKNAATFGLSAVTMDQFGSNLRNFFEQKFDSDPQNSAENWMSEKEVMDTVRELVRRGFCTSHVLYVRVRSSQNPFK